MGGRGDRDGGWRIGRGEREGEERGERKSKNTSGRCEYKRRVPEYARCSFGKGSARARPASATATACGVLGGLLVGLPARRRISRHSSDIFAHIDSTLPIGVARPASLNFCSLINVGYRHIMYLARASRQHAALFQRAIRSQRTYATSSPKEPSRMVRLSHFFPQTPTD
jgi:hypothetical protein